MQTRTSSMATKQLKSLKPPKLSGSSKSELKAYFNNTWELYEMLFSSIKSDKTLYQSPDPLRNPLIFYLGHTAAFYINKFKMAGLISEGVNEKYDHLFAVGVDPDAPENLEVSNFWPTVEEVRAYRQTIFNIVHEVIDHAEWEGVTIAPESPLWTIPMTLEHDRIHFETSSMLIRQLPTELVQCPEEWNYAPTLGIPVQNEWIAVEGGQVTIGKPVDSDLYGWDNEYGQLTVEVQSFRATKNLITNAEFLDFVAAGGYENKQLWTAEGWNWKAKCAVDKPKFWVEADAGIFHYRAMFDEMPMPLDWPVEINAHEALAYCAWKNDGSRLLSEAEYVHIAREGTTENDDPLFSNDHNLDFVYGSPTPVGYLKTATSASGFNDLYGNVWDWLQNDFYALPDFKTHPYYEEFSAPYMDEDHGMMAGGSWGSTGTGASKYYRLWFRRHFYQHAGFRLAQSI